MHGTGERTGEPSRTQVQVGIPKARLIVKVTNQWKEACGKRAQCAVCYGQFRTDGTLHSSFLIIGIFKGTNHCYLCLHGLILPLHSTLHDTIRVISLSGHVIPLALEARGDEKLCRTAVPGVWVSIPVPSPLYLPLTF